MTAAVSVCLLFLCGTAEDGSFSLVPLHCNASRDACFFWLRSQSVTAVSFVMARARKRRPKTIQLKTSVKHASRRRAQVSPNRSAKLRRDVCEAVSISVADIGQFVPLSVVNVICVTRTRSWMHDHPNRTRVLPCVVLDAQRTHTGRVSAAQMCDISEYLFFRSMCSKSKLRHELYCSEFPLHRRSKHERFMLSSRD